MKLSIFSALLVSLAVPAISTAEQPPVPGNGIPAIAESAAAEPSERVRITADSLSYDREKNLFTASGHVRISRGGLTLLSDRALYFENDERAVAEGNVLLERGGGVLRGERVSIDLGSKTGLVTKGSLFIKGGNFHLLGDEIEKTGEETYRITRGTFTTCDTDSPSWKFTASELKVNEYFATGTHALFYIENVPVMYLPYVAFPSARERQTGFLMPRVGNSTKKGIYLDFPYYVNIAPSQDMTVDLDIQSKRGAGAEIDYRYLRPRGSGGGLRGFFIYDDHRHSFRGDFSEKHEEYFSPTHFFKSTISAASDKDFYRDYGEANGDYNRQNLESEIFITKNWEYASLTPDLRYVNNLEGTDRQTLQRMPTVTLTGIERPLAGPLHFEIDAEATNFQREEGTKGERGEIRPRVAAYLHPFSFLDTNVWAQYRARGYNGYGGDPGRGSRTVGFAEAGASASTILQRVFRTDEGSAFRHILIPELAYHFTETKSQERLPFFDFDDRVPGQNLLGWSLTNYFTRKYREGETTRYQELLQLRISQDILLSGTKRDLLVLQETSPQLDAAAVLAVGEKGLRSQKSRLSDLRVETKVSPMRFLTVSTDSRYNTNHNRFSASSLLAELRDDSGNVAGLKYQYLQSEFSFMEGKVGFTLVKPFTFQYTGRYSFDLGDFLESLYSIEYRHQCWSIAFTYRERPEDRAFLVNFTLSGVGSVGNARSL
jgi:LPS-assembly protein